MYTSDIMEESINVGGRHTADVLEGNIIDVKLASSSTDEEVAELGEFLEKLHELAVDLYNKKGEMINALVDLSNFTSYSPKVVSLIADVLKDDKPYIRKTATFGASTFIKLAEETVFALAERNNFKAFDSKKEALEWLASPDL